VKETHAKPADRLVWDSGIAEAKRNGFWLPYLKIEAQEADYVDNWSPLMKGRGVPEKETQVKPADMLVWDSWIAEAKRNGYLIWK
jgi:hypothetical protein